MAKTNACGAAWLEHLLNNVDFANVGDSTGLRGSSTAGSLYVSLHTADPGEAGNQESFEIGYTGYARVAVERNPTTKKWTVSTADPASATNAAEIAFGECTAAAENSTHFGLGTNYTGTGNLLYKGTAAMTISVDSIPRFQAGQLTITED